jgi:peptidoglycan hydrolase-like protein with peptidoglycan-binding domain
MIDVCTGDVPNQIRKFGIIREYAATQKIDAIVELADREIERLGEEAQELAAKDFVAGDPAKNAEAIDEIIRTVRYDPAWTRAATDLAETAILRHGQSVSDLQTRLQDLGFYAGNIDGIVGPMTLAAIQKFQHANGLIADGLIGPATVTKLFDRMV